MVQIREDPAAGRGFPDPCFAVKTTGDEFFVIGAKCRISHPGAMLEWRSGGLAVCGIPQLRGGVVACRDDELAVVAETGEVDHVRMLFQRQRQFPGSGVGRAAWWGGG